MTGTPKEIIDRARAEIRALCLGRCRPGGRDWTMCVPVQADDSDVVLEDAIDLAETLTIVDGYDVHFWRSSYGLLRAAVEESLADFIHEDDVAEEAIYADAIEAAGAKIKELEKAISKAIEAKWRLKPDEEYLELSLRLNTYVLAAGGMPAFDAALREIRQHFLAKHAERFGARTTTKSTTRSDEGVADNLPPLE